MPDMDDRCETCNAPFSAHGSARHPFVAPGGQTDPNLFKTKQQQQVVTAQGGIQVQPAGQWPFDPVLRQALVDKGIVTPQDLADAESKIRMVSGMSAQEVTHGRGIGDQDSPR